MVSGSRLSQGPLATAREALPLPECGPVGHGHDLGTILAGDYTRKLLLGSRQLLCGDDGTDAAV